MIRRVAAILTILAGVALIVAPIVDHVFTAVGPTHRMIKSFTPVMTPATLHTLSGDLTLLRTADTQLTTEAFPDLARQLHLSPSGIATFTEHDFPAVATGLAQLPAVLTHFQGLGDVLGAQLTDFQEAKSIPVSSVPITTMPWGLVVIGALGVIAGALLLRPGRGNAVPVLVLGVIVVAGSLATSLPHKAVSADHLITALAPVMTPATVASATGSLKVVEAMGAQLQSGLLPAVAAQLKATPAQFESALGTDFPAVGRTLRNLPTMTDTFTGLVGKINSNIANYNQAHKVPSLTFLVWLLVGIGAGWIVMGLVGFAESGRGSPAAPARPAHAAP